MKRLLDLFHDRTANFGIITALIAVPVIATAALAIEVYLAMQEKVTLQAAADAAVLSVAASDETNEKAISTKASTFFKSNTAASIAENIKVRDVTYSPDRKITMIVDAKMPLTLGRILFPEGLGISVVASAQQGLSTPIQVVLALDNTGSMAGKKIQDLRSASLSLISILERYNKNMVKVGLVPFSNYVNVGLKNRTQRWMNVVADYSTTQNVCRTSRPVLTKSGCRIVTLTGFNDGVPYTYTQEQCTTYTYGPETRTCRDETSNFKWNGCVGSRSSPMDVSDAFSGTRYPGLMNVSCSAAITPLTGSFSTIRTAVGAMTPQNNTYIPAGVLWGWTLLSEGEPFVEAAADDRPDKYLILMTDGENTLRASGANHVNDTTGAVATQLTTKICENVKTSGIKIFTVGVGAMNNATKQMLANCASSADYAMLAEDTKALTDIFEKFAFKMMSPRLLK